MHDDNRLRVLFVIGSMGGGGAERQVLEILWRLDRKRFIPFLYLAMKQGELLEELPADVPVFAYWDQLPETRSRRWLRMLKLTRLLRYWHLGSILRQQHIDLVYDRTYLATLDAAGGCWFRPTPRISCCVADPQPELEQHARLSARFARRWAQRAYRTASIVLANSEGLRQRVIDYFKLPPEHVKVYANLMANVRRPPANPSSQTATEEELPSPARSTKLDSQASRDSANRRDHSSAISENRRERLIAACGNDDRSFLIVSAGRLHPQKGYQYLLEAIFDVVHLRGRSVRLVIFGQGESEVELQAYIKVHDLEQHVLLAGFDPNPRRWYRLAKLFVLPSLSDAMPNALIEAVVDGIPALATTCPTGPQEILAGGELGGLVPPANASALADSIIDAIDHYPRWKDRAMLAADRVRHQFDPERGVEQLQKLMERIAKANRSS